MNDNRDKMAREVALRRRAGASPEAAERLAAFNEQAEDWTARCRRCGAELKGKLADLRAHVCGGSDGP